MWAGRELNMKSLLHLKNTNSIWESLFWDETLRKCNIKSCSLQIGDEQTPRQWVHLCRCWCRQAINQHWVSLLSMSRCLCSLYLFATFLSVRSSKECWLDPVSLAKSSSKASCTNWESQLGSSRIVVMQKLSSGGWWAAPAAESEPEMDTGGVLVWKGQGGWNRRPVVLLMGPAAGLNSRRDADSRLLRSSAFWENKSWSQFKSSWSLVGFPQTVVPIRITL